MLMLSIADIFNMNSFVTIAILLFWKIIAYWRVGFMLFLMITLI